MDGPWWRGLRECGPQEKGLANQYACLENPMNSMKRQIDKARKDKFPRSVGVQFATSVKTLIESLYLTFSMQIKYCLVRVSGGPRLKLS